MVQSQGNQAEVQGYAHYVNLSFNRGNFTHKIGLDPAIGPAFMMVGQMTTSDITHGNTKGSIFGIDRAVQVFPTLLKNKHT